MPLTHCPLIIRLPLESCSANLMMENFKSYRDLLAWKRAVDLAVLLYSETKVFPKEETFGLTSQIRRAAVSVAANIAEGHDRNSTGEFLQFLGIARGSLAEVETLIILSNRVGLLGADSQEKALKVCEEIGRLTAGLMKSLRK